MLRINPVTFPWNDFVRFPTNSKIISITLIFCYGFFHFVLPEGNFLAKILNIEKEV